MFKLLEDNLKDIKYFKGLGTSKKDDAKDTFNRIDSLRVDYYYKDKLCDDLLVACTLAAVINVAFLELRFLVHLLGMQSQPV